MEYWEKATHISSVSVEYLCLRGRWVSCCRLSWTQTLTVMRQIGISGKDGFTAHKNIRARKISLGMRRIQRQNNLPNTARPRLFVDSEPEGGLATPLGLALDKVLWQWYTVRPDGEYSADCSWVPRRRGPSGHHCRRFLSSVAVALHPPQFAVSLTDTRRLFWLCRFFTLQCAGRHSYIYPDCVNKLEDGWVWTILEVI